MAKGISAMRIKRCIGHVLTCLLIVFYLAGATCLELAHAFVHDHAAAVTHSEAQEKDPCHRLIYHNDGAQGCDHDSHLIVSEKCQMCDLVCHSDQYLLTDINFSIPGFSQGQFSAYKRSLDSYWAVISSSRAPPALA